MKKTSTVMKISQSTNALRINIPSLVRDVLDLHEKDIIEWDINLEKQEVKITKL